MRRRQFLQSVTAAAALSVGQTPTLAAITDPLAIPFFSPHPTSEDAGRDFFYRPKNAWAGDVMPFYKDGRFRLFFSPSWRDPAHRPDGEPMFWPGSWYQTSTSDFVHFIEHGRALPAGNRSQQDLGCFAGNVIE